MRNHENSNKFWMSSVHLNSIEENMKSKANDKLEKLEIEHSICGVRLSNENSRFQELSDVGRTLDHCLSLQYSFDIS